MKPLLGEVAKFLGELGVFVSGGLPGHLRSRLAEEINEELPLHQARLGVLTGEKEMMLLLLLILIVVDDDNDDNIDKIAIKSFGPQTTPNRTKTGR